MKKNIAILSLIAMSLVLAAPLGMLAKGNGAPSGAHYNLNLIGVSKSKTAPMDDNSGHRIFVNLEGKTKINLAEGDTFAVLDANGTDGNGAKFQLPDPNPENDGITAYSVYARALGKPGGNGHLSTCAMQEVVDPDTGDITLEEVCSLTTLYLERKKGKSSFRDVSKELLYIYADLDGNGSVERYPLFSEDMQGYFWDYDNNGLKLVQLRFYPLSADVN